jgi:hypothetical protein
MKEIITHDAGIEKSMNREELLSDDALAYKHYPYLYDYVDIL